MKVWIEISSEYRFQKKIEESMNLYAPATMRHLNMLKNVNIGDVILHYLTAPGTRIKNHKSSIIAISIAKSDIQHSETKLNVNIGDLTNLPCPVSLFKIKALSSKSENLKLLVKVNFQRYLGEIEIEDLRNILLIHPENYNFIKTLHAYKNIFTDK